jgi:histidinol phosphatase-like enzyme (inositol monophosphatase family)
MQKADQSPVTIADQQVETALRDVIQAAFPDDAIQGEEFGSATINTAGNATGRFCWVIDPIDGTKAFISGKPVFGTLVGLTDQGVPLAGMIDMPVLDETYIGHLIGHNPADQQPQSACRMNAAMVRPSPCQTLATARLATTSPLALSAAGLTGFNHLAAQAALTNYGGDCHNYALLAAGHIDLVMEDSLAPHDMIAVVAVMQAAGAVVTDTAGQPIRLGQSSSILAAATADLHAAALTALAEVTAD